jgi:hypothetical protein
MKILRLLKTFLTTVVIAQLCAGAALAQASYTTGFESPPFTLGDVNGQPGWGHISNSPTKGVVEAVPGGSPASFYYRTPNAPVTSTRADGRFAELNPSSKGAEDVANRYAQVRVVNVNHTGHLRFEIGWYTDAAATFCVQTVAENLTWGAWYRLEYDIIFFDGLNGTRPNDVFRFYIYDLNHNLVGRATGSTWESAWKTGSFGGGTTPRAVNGFDLWSQTGPNDALVGLIDNFSMASDQLTLPAADTGSVKISEYRLRGPAGAADEFVELYNNTDADLVVSDPTPPASGPAGWAIVSSDDAGAAKYVVPNGTVIPARGHYLAAGPGYSLSSYPAGYSCNVLSTATPDGAYAADIPDLAAGANGCAAPNTNGRGPALRQ